jgi:hypothetical protein
LHIKAQITQEETYPTLAGAYKLDVSGVKYLVDSTNNINFNLKLYNTDHTLFKSINFPNPYPNFSTHNISYLSENLFDTDAGIEFAVTFINAPNGFRFVIFNEDGTILFNRNKAEPAGVATSFNSNGPYLGIIPTLDGTKMILQTHNPTSRIVYSLPGTLPCWECNGGFTGNRPGDSNTIQEWNSNIYPNPSSDETKIEYTLPVDCKTATLTIFSMEGKIMKSYTITSDFNYILLYNNDLPSGTYYYQITNPNSKKVIEGKQFELAR